MALSSERSKGSQLFLEHVLDMPEAPEVEAVVRTLAPLVRGNTVRHIHVVHRIALRPQSPAAFSRRVSGATITGVERRGKYLLLVLDRGVLCVHFKFDGQFLWLDAPPQKQRKSDSPIHIDVAFEFRSGASLAYVDPRHLGRVQWLAAVEESASLKALGIEAMSPDFTAARLIELCRKYPRPIKMLLTDQARIAGVGNIYSAEALWHARLSPWKKSDALSSVEFRALHKAVVSVLARALECCLDPPPDFRNPQWWFGGVDRMLRVYDREGLACRRCGTKIRRKEQGGRSTYFCPHCQRL